MAHLLYKYCTNCTVVNWTALTVITQKLPLYVQLHNSRAHLLYKPYSLQLNCTYSNYTEAAATYSAAQHYPKWPADILMLNADGSFNCIQERIQTITSLEKTFQSLVLFLSFNTHHQDKFTQSGFYKLTCPDCGKAYIGQTGRDFTSRYNEHKRFFRNDTSTSKFAKHLNDHLHVFGPIKDVMQVVQFHKNPKPEHHWTISHPQRSRLPPSPQWWTHDNPQPIIWYHSKHHLLTRPSFSYPSFPVPSHTHKTKTFVRNPIS